MRYLWQMPIGLDEAKLRAFLGDIPSTPLDIAVLANDQAPGSVLDPKSVTITRLPQHGTATIDPITGQVRYVPNSYYFLRRFCLERHPPREFSKPPKCMPRSEMP